MRRTAIFWIGQSDDDNTLDLLKQLLGSPDFVRRQFHDTGTPRWRTTEDWEYDFWEDDTWVTLRVVWGERGQRGVMLSAEEVPPYWLDTDEREAEFLRM